MSAQRMSISSELLKTTLDYIARHPYAEVFNLIHAIQQDAVVIAEPEPAPAPAQTEAPKE